MNQPLRWRTLISLAVLLAAVRCAAAQERPHVGYVYPAGVGVALGGAEIEVTVGGQHLGGVTGALVSGEGVKAMAVGYYDPEQARRRAASPPKKPAPKPMKKMNPFDSLAKELGLDDPPPKDSGPDLEAIVEAQRQLAVNKSQPNPQLAERVTLYVTVAPDAKPGVRELRLKTPAGVSNPVYFCVGTWQEYAEKEPNDRQPDGGVPDWMPLILNGQIMPGDVDRFRFRATKGTRLVAAASARALAPYLADAVPGWFQATMTLYDARGKKLVYEDDFRFQPDPILCYDVPRTADYILEIKDAIYRGREDFVYRIALGKVPFITGIFPLGGRVGGKSTVALAGWNLLSNQVTLDGADRSPGTMWFTMTAGRYVTNAVPFALDTLPECLEAEPNHERSRAQPLKLPIIVNGRIDRPGDRDIFRITGRAGSTVVAEVQARRLNSPLDSLLLLTDENDKLLAANDDHVDRSAALTTHQADSRLAFQLPKDGTYLLQLEDTQQKGGRAYAYRLRVGAPQPDFALRVVPSSITAPPGTTLPITVHALRRDGFDGDITLGLKGGSAGFALDGGWIPSGQDKVRLTLTMPPTPRRRPVGLTLEGQAVVEGQTVRRKAMPAENMMQAFIYRHLVLTKDWMVTVGGSRRSTNVAWRIVDGETVKLPAGGTARVRVSAARTPDMQQVQVELSDPPEGIAVRKVEAKGSQLSVWLGADGDNIKPGLKGNLIASAVRVYEIKDRDGKPTGNTRRVALGTLPAIPFEIVQTPAETAARP